MGEDVGSSPTTPTATLPKQGKTMSMKEKYLAEYEKYKDVSLSLGLYTHVSSGIEHKIVELLENEAVVRTVHSGQTRTRTLHWCRKYLEKKKAM